MDMSATMTGSAAASTSTSMDMDMGMGDCVISMLWNWNTIDSCFISSSWHVTSTGMFAGSCVGVILLVMLLELLRRTVKEYDAYLVRSHAKTVNVSSARHAASGQSDSASSGAGGSGGGGGGVRKCSQNHAGFRPNVLQQAIRAFLHTAQFAVAYFVMLLAMYYNGYLIICIFIGAFLGAFVFQWDFVQAGSASAAKEATVCCG